MNTINNYNINEMIQTTTEKVTSSQNMDHRKNSGAYEVHLSSGDPVRSAIMPEPATYTRKLNTPSENTDLQIQDMKSSAESSTLSSSTGRETAIRILKIANELPKSVLSLLV